MARTAGPAVPDEPDEFDVEGFATHRTGAHRARPGALARWAVPVLTLGGVLAVLVVLAGALALLGPGGLATLVVRLWDAATSATGLAALAAGGLRRFALATPEC